MEQEIQPPTGSADFVAHQVRTRQGLAVYKIASDSFPILQYGEFYRKLRSLMFPTAGSWWQPPPQCSTTSTMANGWRCTRPSVPWMISCTILPVLRRRTHWYGCQPKNSGKTPKWMVKIMENPIKMDDLGVPLFLETPICPSLPALIGRNTSKGQDCMVSMMPANHYL